MPGVVVLSRIPHGFYEDAMRNFFQQFGSILRLRLARNPKVSSALRVPGAVCARTCV